MTMRVLLFEPRFAELVEAGSKRQTIRAVRKGNIIRAGDELSLRAWTGKPYRSKQRILRPLEKCTGVARITLDEYAIMGDGFCPHKLDSFAHADGFLSWEDMVRWFKRTHGLPFTGDLTLW